MADVADDDRLLDALAVALRPDPSAEPTMVELAALEQVVAEVHSGSGSGSAARVGRRRLRRWAAGVVVGGVVLSGGTAYATNPVAPRPVRSAAFALKLPVESPELTDAKDALDDLEEELAEGRRDHVAAAADDVRDELADLTPDGRRALEPRASALLAAADALLAPRPVGDAVVDLGDGDDGDDGDDVDVDDEDADSSGPGSGRSGSSGSGSGSDDRDGEVDAADLDDSSGSGSGSSGSGSGGDDVDAEDLDDEDRSGSNSGRG